MSAGGRTALVSNRGIFSNESEALSEILRRLVKAFDPASIWLFGSRAEGRQQPDSDFDLLIVAKPGGGFGTEDYERVIAPLLGLGVGCDIIPCSSEDFSEAAGIKTSLVAQILARGRRLYDAETR